MEGIKTSIDHYDKVLIPAKLRKELKFQQGDTLVIRRVGNELRLISLNSVLEKIQKDFKSRSKTKKSALAEFLADKKAE
jgi:bifunctional DNA-binding transcriptional regulator/antitoxin component of YhaV-PrlF toxin-antitoxin module